MRQRNMRLVIVGLVMIGLAIGFFLYMMSIAGSSTDPKALMEIVGTVSGVVGALGIFVGLIGFVGKKV